MKHLKKATLRAILLLLAAALILTSGCSPAATPPKETGAAQTNAPAKQDTSPAPERTGPAPDGQTENTQSVPPQSVPAEETGEPIPETTEAPDPYSFFGVSMFEQGSYTDEFGYNYTYTYEVPCLDADTVGAKAINTDIDRRFGQLARSAMEGMEEGLSLGILHVGSRAVAWEDVLTVIVIAHYDFDWTDYGVYCYDTGTGNWLSTRELLARMDVDPEAFLEAARAEALRTFDEGFGSLSPDENIRTARDWTESDEAIHLDMKAYPEADGSLCAVAPIGSVAGPAYFYEQITVLPAQAG